MTLLQTSEGQRNTHHQEESILLVQVSQRNRTNRIYIHVHIPSIQHMCIYTYVHVYINACVYTSMYIQKENYYEQLAHTVLEAEKPYNLPSASWRRGRRRGIVPSGSEGLNTKEADISLSLRTGENEPRCSSSPVRQVEKRGLRASSFFPCWHPPPFGTVIHFAKSTVSKLISSETPSQTQPEIMFNLGTWWPVKLTQN